MYLFSLVRMVVLLTKFNQAILVGTFLERITRLATVGPMYYVICLSVRSVISRLGWWAESLYFQRIPF